MIIAIKRMYMNPALDAFFGSNFKSMQNWLKISKKFEMTSKSLLYTNHKGFPLIVGVAVVT